ncbi:unnamed protein product, partial [Nezara viridula]
MNADTLRLNLIELARTGSRLVGVAGHVDFMCQEVEAADPITFTTPASHLDKGNVQKHLGTSSPGGIQLERNGLEMAQPAGTGSGLLDQDLQPGTPHTIFIL